MNKKIDKFKSKNLFESMGHAINGIMMMTKERNMQTFFLINIIFIILNIINHSNYIEWIILFIISFLVYVAETINTSIEIVVDMIVKEPDQNAKRAKDIAAGATFFFGMLFFICEITIFLC